MDQNRLPGVGLLKLCPAQIDAETACKLLLEDPTRPKILGISTAHYSAANYSEMILESDLPYRLWPPFLQQQAIMTEGNFSKPGPFVRFLSLSRFDGQMIAFDLTNLRKFPLPLLNILLDPSMCFVGHETNVDLIALQNTHSSLAALNIIDIQKIWLTLQDQKTLNFLHTKNLRLDDFPLAVEIVGADLISMTFYLLRRCHQLEPKNKGMDYLLNVTHMDVPGQWALRSLMILDCYTILDKFREMLSRVQTALFPERKLMYFELCPTPVWERYRADNRLPVQGPSFTEHDKPCCSKSKLDAPLAVATDSEDQSAESDDEDDLIVVDEINDNDDEDDASEEGEIRDGDKSTLSGASPSATSTAEAVTNEKPVVQLPLPPTPPAVMSLNDQVRNFVRRTAKRFRDEFGRPTPQSTWTDGMEQFTAAALQRLSSQYKNRLPDDRIVYYKADLYQRLKQRAFYSQRMYERYIAFNNIKQQRQ